jgi:hypothetical protein
MVMNLFVIMSPLRTEGDMVLVWFFLPLLLLLSEACPDHNFFVANYKGIKSLLYKDFKNSLVDRS